MLISQEARSGTPRLKGSGRASFAELRRRLADPSLLSDADRQRLARLADRLARVQALGGEYVRVDFSDAAAAALAGCAT